MSSRPRRQSVPAPSHGRRPSPALSGSQLSTIPEMPRRSSGSGLAMTSHKTIGVGAPKAQRTSKTSQKLVVLPSEPQTKPLPRFLARRDGEGLGAVTEDEEEDEHDTDFPQVPRERKSEGERLSKKERTKAGYKRLTAYCVAEGFKMNLLTSFLKREHNVTPRVFDEAVYTLYHLPLLPGYTSSVNLRSSVATKTPGTKSLLRRMSEAEERGYEGTYFPPTEATDEFSRDGFIASTSPNSPVIARAARLPPDSDTEAVLSETDGEGPESDATTRPLIHQIEAQQAQAQEPQPSAPPPTQVQLETLPETPGSAETIGLKEEDAVADVIFFSYGVAVFFGLAEQQELDILADLKTAGILVRKFKDDDWEIEECHYVHDPSVAYPRIFNDLFTLKSYSHLLKLSISHALAQSTLLAHYESSTQSTLSHPSTISIPRQLASTGALTLRRREALRLTGKLFTLRRDINLVSNVLDTPELFWSEASLKGLYDAVRGYLEIEPRVAVLNERLAVAQDLLDGIHNHLNNNAMERITWIIIWLIVVACLVEAGEIFARLVVHATTANPNDAASMLAALPRQEAIQLLQDLLNESP